MPRVERDALAADEDAHPGARVAAVVHEVVDEPGVAAQRGPAAGGAEVGLGRDRVLAVGELVGDVGEQLDERDAEVGRAALASSRREQAEPVEHQPAEASRSPWRGSRSPAPSARLGRAVAGGAQSKSRRALDLERELDRGQQRVEPGRRRVAAARRRRGAACSVEKSPRESVRTSSTVAGSSSPATSAGSSPAGSAVAGATHSTPTVGIRSPPSIVDVRRRSAPRRRLQQPDEQRPLAQRLRRRLGVRDLEVLDAVERAGLLDRPQAALVAAARTLTARSRANDGRRRAACVRSTTYATVDRRARPRPASTSTDSTAIRWPSHCWSAPCTRCCVVADELRARRARRRGRAGRCRSRAA